MKLEIKKYKLTKYIKGIFIATVCIIAFITVWVVVLMKIIPTQIILIWPRKEVAGWQKQYIKN